MWPPNVTEFTENSITILSLAFSLRLSVVAVIVTVAPAGIVTPFEPLTGEATVAVTRSPTFVLFVQTRDVECSVSSVPAAIVPAAPPPVPPVVPRVTVLPLEVFVGVVVVVRVVVVGRVVVVRGVVVRGVVVAGVVAGTSVSCGCAALSRLASDRSRLSALSAARVVSFLALSPLHAPSASSDTVTNDRLTRVVYLNMEAPPEGGTC